MWHASNSKCSYDQSGWNIKLQSSSRVEQICRAMWPSWKISMPPSLLSWAMMVKEPQIRKGLPEVCKAIESKSSSFLSTCNFLESLALNFAERSLSPHQIANKNSMTVWIVKMCDFSKPRSPNPYDLNSTAAPPWMVLDPHTWARLLNLHSTSQTFANWKLHWMATVTI